MYVDMHFSLKSGPDRPVPSSVPEHDLAKL